MDDGGTPGSDMTYPNPVTQSQICEFRHLPLQDAASQLMHLKIRPDDHAAPISVSFEHFDIECTSLYTAISYTWDSTQPTKVLYVNGRQMKVRYNC